MLRVSGASESGEYLPYFFLSYARTPRNDPNGPNPDIWVQRLYNDLSNEILQHTSLPHGVQPGFMDVDLQAGVEWERRLATELAMCRVFVPLYSRRYFHSVQCGKEWAAFDLRRRRHANGRRDLPEVIVPAYWVPVPEYEMPVMAKTIQFTDPALGPHYVRRGLYEMMKIGRFRDHYKSAVFALARRIIEVAEGVRLPAGEPADYASIRSAFTRDPERRFQVTIVAATKESLRGGRVEDYYGSEVVDWNPYHPHSFRPLTDVVTNIIRELDFEPKIGPFEDHYQALVSNRTPACPGLVLLDPWALTDRRNRELLRELDQANNPWIGVIIPWNGTDGQISERSADLRETLQAVLPFKIAQARLEARRAMQGLPTAEEFESTLRPLLQRLASSYLRNAQAFPPKTPGSARPRLWGPQDDRPEQEGMP